MSSVFNCQPILISRCRNLITVPPEATYYPRIQGNIYTASGASALAYTASGLVSDPLWTMVSDPGLTPGLTPAAYIIDPTDINVQIFFEPEYIAEFILLSLTTASCPINAQLFRINTRLQSPFLMTPAFYPQHPISSSVYEIQGPLYADTPVTGSNFYNSSNTNYLLFWKTPPKLTENEAPNPPYWTDYFFNNEYSIEETTNLGTVFTSTTNSFSLNLKSAYYITAEFSSFDGYNRKTIGTPEHVAECHSPHLLEPALILDTIESITFDSFSFADVPILVNEQDDFTLEMTLEHDDPDAITIPAFSFFQQITDVNEQDDFELEIAFYDEFIDTITIDTFDFYTDLGAT